MKIDIPDIKQQQKAIFEESTKAAIKQLKENLKAPVIESQSEIEESQYSNAHLLTESQGFESPHPDIVGAYFRHFQQHFPEYGTDKRLSVLLGVNSDRRIRAFKDGSRKCPYGIWRKFLIITGRAPQEIIQVKAFMA